MRLRPCFSSLFCSRMRMTRFCLYGVFFLFSLSMCDSCLSSAGLHSCMRFPSMRMWPLAFPALQQGGRARYCSYFERAAACILSAKLCKQKRAITGFDSFFLGDQTDPRSKAAIRLPIRHTSKKKNKQKTQVLDTVRNVFLPRMT